jgi:hypothetical protein
MNLSFLHIFSWLNNSLLFFPFIVVLGRDIWWHLQMFLQCINYIILEFIPSTTPLCHSLPLIQGIVSTGIIFAFTCICIHFYAIFTLLPPFPTTSPLPLVPTLPGGQDLFHPLVLRFHSRKKIKKKIVTFLLVWGKGS